MTDKWTVSVGRVVTTNRQADGTRQVYVGEMVNRELVQLAHVKGVTVTVLVANHKQCASRPHSAGLYRAAVTTSFPPQMWANMLAKTSRR